MTLTIEKNLPSISDLPDNYLIKVDHLSAITLSGQDKSSYLQGQVTCDVNQLNNNLLIGAHCDAKGKMISLFRLFERNNSFWLLQPKSTLKASLTALQKFGVFAKVDIQEADKNNIYALVGSKAAQHLQHQFKQIPDSMTPVVHANNSTLIYITCASEAKNTNQQAIYLVINEHDALEQIVANFFLPIYKHELWNFHEINHGFPLMNEASIGEYVPQMLNVQAINGISFTKGCYLGQETVARMQYLGRNKRAMFTLIGESKTLLNEESLIEMQLGDNWRRAGKILSYYQADNGSFYLQTVLASDIGNNSTLRIKLADDVYAPITFQALPYEINHEDT